ncbi:30S ribosomal protein S3 [Patescibacteria group bacterium]|nr:30S ribosomal protein S3 [Patescibacteria group bacterium]
MGQKADPRGLRVGVTKSRSSEWFAKTRRQGAQFFVQDMQVRKFVEESFKRCGIAKIVIRKTDKECEVIVFTAKPALILGKEGKKLEEFQAKLVKKFGGEFKVVLKDVRLPELSAKIMGEFAATQLEARMPFRRVAKTLLQKVMEKGATGVKVQVSGRLGGVDLSRSEKFSQGRVSLQTLRSDIDYHVTTALTKYGILGIKIWISRGDLITKTAQKSQVEEKKKAMEKIVTN